MIIGYRRYGSNIGLSDSEVYTTGGWHEKRINLIKTLRELGHSVVLLNKPTFASTGLWDYQDSLSQFNKIDILFLELSAHFGLNSKWLNYSVVIKETIDLISKLDKRKLLFVLIDDPDFKFKQIVKMLGIINKQVILLVNGNDQNKLNEYFKNYFNAGEVKLFLFHGLIKPSIYVFNKQLQIKFNKIIYYGDVTGGRLNKLIRLLEQVQVDVYSKFSSPVFKTFKRVKQHQRFNLYSQYQCSLGLASKKHKELGWNMGRIFTSILAGTPVIVEDDNPLKKRFLSFNETNIKERVNFVLSNHDKVLKMQQLEIEKDRAACFNVLKHYGI